MKQLVQKQIAQSIATLQAVLAEETISDTLVSISKLTAEAMQSGDEELVAGLHGFGSEFGDGDERVGDGLFGEDSLQGCDGLSDLLLDQLLHEFSGARSELIKGTGL